MAQAEEQRRSSCDHILYIGIYIVISAIFGIGELICNILALDKVDFYSEYIFYAIIVLMITEAYILYNYCSIRLLLNKSKINENDTGIDKDCLVCIIAFSWIPIFPLISVASYHDIDGVIILLLSPLLGIARILTLFHNKLSTKNYIMHKYLHMQNISITNGIFSLSYSIIYIIALVKAKNNNYIELLILALSFSSICFIYYVILMLLKLNGAFNDVQPNNNGGG